MRFKLETIITMSSGKMLCDMTDLRDLADFMCNTRGIMDVGLCMVADRCKNSLLKQFPILGREFFGYSIDKLCEELHKMKTQDERMVLIDKWMDDANLLISDTLNIKMIGSE